jgi:hypothetical protein
MNKRSLLSIVLFLAAIGCGGATTSAESDAGESDTGTADASTTHDAQSDTSVAPDQSSPTMDAGFDGAAKIVACDACLQMRCAASYARCAPNATCVQQLNDTTLCRQTTQDAIPGELVLCYGMCDVCLCHP